MYVTVLRTTQIDCTLSHNTHTLTLPLSNYTGPLGQCFPIPDDQSIRAEMMRFVHNYAHIYSMYNFDYDPEPGSVQHKIDQRIARVSDFSE